MKKTLAELAELLRGEVLGDGAVAVTGVTSIDDAGPNDITFAVPPHLEKAANSGAAAVVIPATVDRFPKPAIRVDNPRAAFAQLLELFTPAPAVQRGIHPMAMVGQGVRLGENVAIMAYVVIDDGAAIGDNTVIYPHTYIGAGTQIGADTLIYPNVTIREHCRIGSRVIIHSGAVIGSDGFGFVTIGGRHKKVPQIGNVIIEDDVEIGANVAIDRATTGSTIVRAGTKIDNLVHLAHNVVIGENCFLVAQTGIAGSAKVGNNVTFAGQSGSAGHLTIGDNCVFAARTAVISDVPAGSFYAGFPARPHKEWLRGEAAIQKVPDLIKKVRDLERRLAVLEGKEKEQ
ncbi:UDP-3-O-(3-hydroxymyristoyl)glucosamine N-acyltransferase [Sporolituus thermophilus]|uniref:UDP-3-O-acylglucosamine N-acyltransferase n=1 Tax=Sporolituus thermophilus DSM 23256 TaxID=1123285 RepID=A0A1G7HFD0_9FIRM|nr:UDP-3-O-(3-hydroxymyristoyl)glucosamine N-acyltransferase [Sporolituus thermophilus]SDE99014.1 UDP-3-O-[3-hydroxymyristoyl] glucosamine N-acyltransferase [Sporolituus thermophilus DSM 23256]